MPFLCLVVLYVGIASLIAAEAVEEGKAGASSRGVAMSPQAKAQAYIDAAFDSDSLPDEAKINLQTVTHTLMSCALSKVPTAHSEIFCKHVRIIAKMYESPSPCAIACLALLYVEGKAGLLAGTTLEKPEGLKELISTLFDEKSIDKAQLLIGLAERKINPGFARGFL